MDVEAANWTSFHPSADSPVIGSGSVLWGERGAGNWEQEEEEEKESG